MIPGDKRGWNNTLPDRSPWINWARPCTGWSSAPSWLITGNDLKGARASASQAAPVGPGKGVWWGPLQLPQSSGTRNPPLVSLVNSAGRGLRLSARGVMR